MHEWERVRNDDNNGRIDPSKERRAHAPKSAELRGSPRRGAAGSAWVRQAAVVPHVELKRVEVVLNLPPHRKRNAPNAMRTLVSATGPSQRAPHRDYAHSDALWAAACDAGGRDAVGRGRSGGGERGLPCTADRTLRFRIAVGSASRSTCGTYRYRATLGCTRRSTGRGMRMVAAAGVCACVLVRDDLCCERLEWAWRVHCLSQPGSEHRSWHITRSYLRKSSLACAPARAHTHASRDTRTHAKTASVAV